MPRSQWLLGAFACMAIPQLHADPADGPGRSLEEVTVTAHKQIDLDTLDHVIIPQFVASHGTPSERIGQIGRWADNICPEIHGLQPLYDEFVSRRVIAVARSVGAPTPPAGRCTTNVDIVFTTRPQEVLDDIARTSPVLLGYSQRPAALRTMRHPIEARYLTGTRSFVSLSTSVNGNTPTIHSGLQIDNVWDPIVGQAGSRLGDHVRSEFARVTVIADSNALLHHSLQSIADYIAMLVLTRSALEGCNALPSILDLLSSDCGGRTPPTSMTDADSAYLKALYTSNLEVKLNLEHGELHARKLPSMQGP
jgi:hypothetical protein